MYCQWTTMLLFALVLLLFCKLGHSGSDHPWPSTPSSPIPLPALLMSTRTLEVSLGIQIPPQATTPPQLRPCSGIPILLQILRRSHRSSAIQIPTLVPIPTRIKTRLPILEEACLVNSRSSSSSSSSHRQAG